MHAADLKRSDRLQRVLQVLTALPQASTLQIQELANCCAVGTSISELRSAGYLITCERRDRVYYYSLIGQEVAA